MTPYVFTTSEASQALVGFARQQNENVDKAFLWSPLVPSLDEAPPIFPGQTMVLHAASGEGKSSVSKWLIKEMAKAVTSRFENDKVRHKILSVVLEETIELARANTMSHPITFAEIASGKADVKQVLKAVADSALDPIYYVGPSIMGGLINPNAAEFNGITPKQLGEIFYQLQTEQNVSVAGVCLDYIQIMSDNRNSTDRYPRVTNASMEMLNVSRSTLRCPVIICAQSSKEVKERGNKIPGLYDIQHSSQIAQDADIVWSMWHPASEPFGTQIKIMGKEIFPFNDIFIVSVCKWRNTSLNGKMFILCGGRPFGNFFEIPFDVLSSISPDDVKQLRVRNFMDLPESVRKF